MLQWMLQCCYCDTMNVSVVTVLQDSIMDASEESQLEAAIRLSLAESTKNTRPECDLNVLSDDDDSDDDILETFTSSDSDTERPKQLCQPTKSSSTKSSPAAAAAAAGSEATSEQNETEAGSHESEAGASNCVCVNGTELGMTTSQSYPCQGSSRDTSQGGQHNSTKEETLGHGSEADQTGQGSSGNGRSSLC